MMSVVCLTSLMFFWPTWFKLVEAAELRSQTNSARSAFNGGSQAMFKSWRMETKCLPDVYSGANPNMR